jgi:hypothetical protein
MRVLISFTLALILTFSPGEKEQLLRVSILLAVRSANLSARIFKGTADDAPAPW